LLCETAWLLRIAPKHGPQAKARALLSSAEKSA
jgi:hypothetical protein